MSDYGIRQIKLTTGDEIICEIIDWQDQQVDVRKVLKISSVSILEDVETVYVLRTWMTYSTDFDETITINPLTIVATCEPSYIMEMQYYEGLDMMRKHMHNLEESYKSFEEDSDSTVEDSGSNVIKLFRGGDDTVH